MVLFDYIRVVIVTSLVVEGATQAINPQDLENYNNICQSLTSDPSFEKSAVVSSTWTIYYSWNINLTHDCPELSFRYPNDESINRIYSHMHGHLMTQPSWADAVLEMTMEGSTMLLFNDPSGTQGLFQGVPLFEDKEFDYAFKSTKIPMLNTAMKLVWDGRFLLSSSCHVYSGSVLAVRRKGRPKKEEIDAVASAYDFGIRYSTCIKAF